MHFEVSLVQKERIRTLLDLRWSFSQIKRHLRKSTILDKVTSNILSE